MKAKKNKSKRIVLKLIAVTIVIIVVLIGIKIYNEYKYPLKFENYIYEYSEIYDVDPHLVMAMIRVESNFIHDAKSHKNAKGLMQIMDDTGVWIAQKIGLEGFETANLSKPDTNIQMGVWYIDWLLEKFDGQEHLALAAYNGGIGNVQKWLKDTEYSSDGKTLHTIPFKETEKYVEKVLKYKEEYKKIY